MKKSVAQSMVEYAIIAALVAVVALGAVKAFGSGIVNVFNNVTEEVRSIENTGGN